MNIQPIQNTNPKYKNNRSFGSFIRLELYSGSQGADGFGFHISKKVVNENLETITEIVAKIKEVVGDKLNFYRRNLKFNPLTKQVYDTEVASKTLFIEDNNGKNREELLKATNLLLDKGGENSRFEIYSGNLFAPKEKGLLNRSLLQAVARNAKPEDMIKM